MKVLIQLLVFKFYLPTINSIASLCAFTLLSGETIRTTKSRDACSHL